MAEGRPILRGLTGNGQLVLLLFAVALVSADNFADPDLWMHILAGRLILAGHVPPMADPYSYSVPGFPWRDHEWFAQAAMALSYNALGVIGLKLVKVACAAVMIGALAVGIAQTQAGTGRYFRLVLIVFAALMVEPMQLRPQIFTFVMLSILLATLAVEIYQGGARLWVLVPMFALWVNLHAGYTVGLGALGVATAVLSIQAIGDSAERSKAMRLAAATVGCGLATLLNPVGLEAIKAVPHAVSDPLFSRLVVEWQSTPRFLAGLWNNGPKLFVPVAVAPIILFAVFLVLMFRAPDSRDAPMTAIAIVFICAGLYVARNVSLALIAVAIPLAHRAALAFGGQDDSPPAPAIMAVLAGLLIVAGGTFSNRLQTWHRMPSGAVSFMQRNHLRGNILNQFEWGDYLAWHKPDSRIFIDSRDDTVYPDSVLLQYARFYFGLSGGEKVLDAYPNDFVLLDPKSKAYKTMLSEPRWQLTYQDATSALFQRSAESGKDAMKLSLLAHSQPAPEQKNTIFP